MIKSSGGAIPIENYVTPLGLIELTIIKSINISSLWDLTLFKQYHEKVFFTSYHNNFVFHNFGESPKQNNCK